MRQNARARARNRTQRAALRTAVRKVRTAGTADEAVRALATAEVLLDRAARKQLIHPNAAARLKSRLSKVRVQKP